MTNLEDDIRSVFDRQAAALDVPSAAAPAAAEIVMISSAESNGMRQAWARRLPMVAAVVVLVIGLWAVVVYGGANDGSDGPADGGESLPTVVFEAPQVKLSAQGVEVIAGDRTFTPAVDTISEGDPGNDAYTTLELTWFEDDIEMRINMYFASDGDDWWVSEIRSYDGENDADWVTSMDEFFRTPLGDAYEGQLDLDHLRIDGLHLEAFTGGDGS